MLQATAITNVIAADSDTVQVYVNYTNSRVIYWPTTATSCKV